MLFSSFSKWIDDEAVLSGSDVESDEEEDSEDQDDDFVESMDVDEDEVDQTELRDGIIKTHMKLVNIDGKLLLIILDLTYLFRGAPSQ